MSRNTAIASSILADPERELTELQARFADEYMANGGNGALAATSAGYAPEHAANAAWRNLRNPVIQHAIMRAVLERIGLAAVPALGVVESLSRSARSDYVRLEAARDLLDRAGFRPPERVESQLDAGLTVELNLGVTLGSEGGSKTVAQSLVTHPHTGKSRPEDAWPVDFPTIDGDILEKGDTSWSKEGAPGGSGGPRVDFEAEEVDFPTIPPF